MEDNNNNTRNALTWWGHIKVAFQKRPVPIYIGLFTFVAAWALFVWAAQDLRARLARVVKDPNRLSDLWTLHIPITSLLLGLFVWLGVWLVFRARRANPGGQLAPLASAANAPGKAAADNGTEFLLKAIVPFAAAAFFLYQVIAGSFFATTSVTAKGMRCLGGILVSVTLERGDNWLVNVPIDVYHVGPIVPGEFDQGWLPMEFPRKRDGQLRLAPKEKTSTMFFIDAPPAAGTVIVVGIDAYAMYWPVATESFASFYVPASTAEADKKQCAAIVGEKKREES